MLRYRNQLQQQDESSDVEVELADQERINAYSTLNHRLTDIEERLQILKVCVRRAIYVYSSLITRAQDEKEQLDDLSTELELADEDEPVLYKVAAAFHHLKPEQALERVTKSLAELDESVDSLESEADTCKEKMSELKAMLYAKFGSASALAHIVTFALICSAQTPSTWSAIDLERVPHS